MKVADVEAGQGGQGIVVGWGGRSPEKSGGTVITSQTVRIPSSSVPPSPASAPAPAVTAESPAQKAQELAAQWMWEREVLERD